jgi:hypothetical protein
MTTVDALLIGVFSTLCGIGIFLAGRKVWQLLSILPSLRDIITKQYWATIDLVTSAKAIAAELQYMRSIATASQAAQEPPPGFNPFEPPAQPGSIPPFPSPILDRFPRKPPPDAEVGDTDDVSLTQTDEDMAQLEIIEKLRSQGVQIDEPDVEHPGITVESK